MKQGKVANVSVLLNQFVPKNDEEREALQSYRNANCSPGLLSGSGLKEVRDGGRIYIVRK